MAKFELAIDAVLKNEGGLSNHPLDSGQITNFGISFSFYKTIKPDATVLDIKNLTSAQAIDLYEKYFWLPNKYNLITNQQVANKVFDMAVNMGAEMANKCLQRAIFASTGYNLAQDGIIGPQTLGAVNRADPGAVLPALKSEAAGYYRYLIAKNPSLDVFSRGWLHRAYATA